MAELTKKDVKEAVVEAFTPFADVIQQDFIKVHEEIADVKSDVKETKEDVKGVKMDVGSINVRLTSVEKDVKWMKENSSELFEKLDRFIKLYEDQKQELTSLSAQLERIEKRVTKLEG